MSEWNLEYVSVYTLIKGFKNFVPYEYFELGMSLVTLVTVPFILWIAFDKSPTFVKKLDAERRKSILPVEKLEKGGDMKELGAGKAQEAKEVKDNQKPS